VTTDPARALGELWQYPKTVGTVTFDNDESRRESTVSVDGQRVLTLAVGRPRTIPVELSARSYTDGDGTVRSVPVHVDGDGGLGPGWRSSHLDLGEHPWADQLRVLEVGSRPLLSVSFEGEFVIDPPERLD
jgi:hypothetical protein